MEYSEDLEAEIFNHARELTDAEARERYLLDACGSSPRMERRVRAMLQMLINEDAFLETPVETVTVPGQVFPDEADYVGSSIDPYLLVEKIGAGGMGLVFRAEQTSPVRRQVALKIIRPEVNAAEMLDRFQAERQILARLQHPGVIQLLDAGTASDGRPWFAMELIEGMSVTRFCREHQVSIPDRLRLFESVCDAVHHVHQKGVLHRDLKSSNVIVTQVNDRWIPKVIDFGVACLSSASESLKTSLPLPSGQQQANATVLIGTPSCMSPEQTSMPDTELEARCDVFALGVLLYELLTDKPMYRDVRWESMSSAEIVRTICEYSPCRPSEAVFPDDSRTSANELKSFGLMPRMTSSRSLMLQGDLDDIVMKAVEKDRARRYASVAALSADVRRYLQNEPVEAAPSTVRYRLKKFATRRRSRIAIAALTFGLLALLLAVFIVTWSLQVKQEELARHKQALEEQNQRSQKQSTAQRQREYSENIQAAYVAYFRGGLEQSRQRLAACADESGNASAQGFEWRLLKQLCTSQPMTMKGLDGKVFDVEFSPDGRLLISCTGDRAYGFNVWNAQDGRLVQTVEQFGNDVNSLAFTADGGTLLTGDENRCVKSWSVASWNELPGTRLEDYWMPVGQIHAIKGSSAVIASQVDWKSRAARTSLRELGSASDQVVLEGQRFLAASPAHGLAVFAGNHGEISLRPLSDVSKVQTVLGTLTSTPCGCISGDGRFVACGDTNGNVKVWRTSDGDERTLPKNGPGDNVIRDIAFSADSRYLIAASHDGVVEIWDVASWTVVRVLYSPHGEAWSLAVSADGDKFAVGYASGHIEIHRWEDAVRPRQLIIQTDVPVRDIVASPQMDRIAVLGSMSKSVRVHSANDGSLLQTIPAVDEHCLTATLFSSAGDSIWVCSEPGVLSEFELATGQIKRQLKPNGTRIHVPFLKSAGSLLSISDMYNPKFHSGVWHTDSRQELIRLTPQRPDEWSRIWGFCDENTILSSSGKSLSRWNLQTRTEVSPTFEAVSGIAYVSLVPSDATALLGLQNGTIHVFDLATQKTTAVLEGHRSIANASALSPNGRTLATGGRAGDIRLWRSGTYAPLCELHGLTGHILGIWFTPDGNRLIAAAHSASGGADVLVWNATEPKIIR